nr:polyprotein [Sugarcane bacilliform virus]
MAQRVRGTGSSTVLDDGAVLNDQIRDYRLAQHLKHELSRKTAKALSWVKTTDDNPREQTLEMVMSPEAELERSLRKRARAFPAEVIYAPRSDDIHHRVFIGSSSQDIMVVDDNQLDMTYIKEESFEQLEQSGLRYIHIGAIAIRIQPLHAAWSGKLVFLVIRDVRNNPPTTLGAMEVDISKGAQLIYVLPNFMCTIKDFYHGIQLSIKTKGYEGWQGEANLHLERLITGRLSNTSNVAFKYKINGVTAYLKTNGIKAIDAKKESTKKIRGGEWNIQPSRVEIAMEPKDMTQNQNFDGTTSFRFSNFQASASRPAPIYNDEDEVDMEAHMALCEEEEETDQEWIDRYLSEYSAQQKMVGINNEEEEIISTFLSAIPQEEEAYPAEEIEEEYPAIKRLEQIMKTRVIVKEVPEKDQPEEAKMAGSESSAIWQPGTMDLDGNLPGYAPAQSATGWDSAESSKKKNYGGYSRKFKHESEFFNLPSAMATTGAILVLTMNNYAKEFDRWQSINTNLLATQTFETADDKITRIENLMGETEKLMFQTWRMAFPTDFNTLKDQALGTNGTANVFAQVKRVLLGEVPEQGTTGVQDAAYKIKSLVCTEMTYPALMRYMVGYRNLAARSGRAWANNELTNEFFTKLPGKLGDKIKEAFVTKYPSVERHVPSAIRFTYDYLEEVCTENNFQKQLRSLNFCKGFPVVNPAGTRKYGKKYGTRKSRTYRGKPHSSHVRIERTRYLKQRKDDKGEKKCRCYVCGSTEHLMKDCKSPMKRQDRVNLARELDIPDNYDIVSVGFDEKDTEDIYSVSENEENQAHLGLSYEDPQLPTLPQNFEEWEDYYKDEFSFMAEAEDSSDDEKGPFLVGPKDGFRHQMTVSQKQYKCIHDWEFQKDRTRPCKRCLKTVSKGEYAYCKTCKVGVCNDCAQWCYQITPPSSSGVKKIPSVINYEKLAKQLLLENSKLKEEKRILIEELNKEIKARLDLEKNKAVFVEETSSEVNDEIEMWKSKAELYEALYNEALTRPNDNSVKEGLYQTQISYLTKELRQLESNMEVNQAVESEDEIEAVSLMATTVRDQMFRFPVVIEVPEVGKVQLTALLDTGATRSCINKPFIEEKMLQDTAFKVRISGVNSVTYLDKQVKDGAKLWAGDSWFRLPLTYVGNMHIGEKTQMLIGCNFIQALAGGVRLEGRTVTFYKYISSIQANEFLQAEAEEINIATTKGGFIDRPFMQKNKQLIEEMKEQGYMGEDTLKHWEKNKVKCKIELINPDLIIKDKPITMLTIQTKEAMRKHVDALLARGVIRKSSSPHRTNAFIVESGTSVDPVTKKEIRGKSRLVFNYKRLNDNTWPDQYSLPGINALLKNVARARIFSKFDLKSGFHQVAMDPESIPLTAFTAYNELYEWLVMPFGLKNAPAVFQRKMDDCFRGTERFIAVYIDDILVFSNNEEDHAEHLWTMLQICKKNGLILSPSKYKIGVKRVDFLGSTIGDNQLAVQEHIVSKIAEFDDEKLKTKEGLKSWLATLNYARNHIKDMGKMLGPLYPKTSEKGAKGLNSEDWKLISRIKTMVRSLPNLTIPPEDAYIIIETDACATGWGAICKWKKSKADPRSTELICRYASGKFDKPKGTCDAEIYGVMNGLEKMRLFYLDKREITVRTDSAAIERFYNKSVEHKPSEIRWIRFMDYITGAGPKIVIEHIKGKHNGLADILSRLKAKLAESPSEEVILLAKALKEVAYYPDHPQVPRLIEWGKQLLDPFPAFKKDNFERTEYVMMANQEPTLLCGCRKPAYQFTSGTKLNPRRRFYKCAGNLCHGWYWEDLLEEYVQERIEEFMVREFDQKMGNLAEQPSSSTTLPVNFKSLADLKAERENILDNPRSSIIDRPRPSDEHFKPGYMYPNSLQKIKEDYASPSQEEPPWEDINFWLCKEEEDFAGYTEDNKTEDALDLTDVSNDDQWRRS